MENQTRGQFLKTLGLSTQALMAFYCLGSATSCTKEEAVAPAPTPTPTATGITGSATGGTINFTLDLKNATYSKLATTGEFLIIGDVLVANTGSNNYIALSKACPHAGTTVEFRKDKGDIYCPNHGSEFKTDGSVNKAPATKALTKYTTTYDGTKSTLKVA